MEGGVEVCAVVFLWAVPAAGDIAGVEREKDVPGMFTCGYPMLQFDDPAVLRRSTTYAVRGGVISRIRALEWDGLLMDMCEEWFMDAVMTNVDMYPSPMEDAVVISANVDGARLRSPSVCGFGFHAAEPVLENQRELETYLAQRAQLHPSRVAAVAGGRAPLGSLTPPASAGSPASMTWVPESRPSVAGETGRLTYLFQQARSTIKCYN